MKGWKEQLIKVKRDLRKPVSRKQPSEVPAKVDFDPPRSWLTHEPSTSKRNDRPKENFRSALTPSETTNRRVNVQRRVVKADQTSPQRFARSATSSSESAKRVESPNKTAHIPVFRPRINETDFLDMPEWSKTGSSLQHPNQQGENTNAMSVRIGVDFGTAFTKVAIRVGRNDLVPVDWSAVTGDESQTGRYVMPGFVIRSLNGEYCWRRLTEADIQMNLKLPVIDMASSGVDKCPTATLAHLALVIRYARAFLYRHPEVGRKLVVRSLRWELNIGCPTEPHERPEVVRLFRCIARTAWYLAALGNLMESDIAAAWRAYRTDEKDVGLEAEPGVVPEFVAQIAGYLNSRQVSEGLHALIDFGAATLDIATFNVVFGNDIEPSPKIPIFFSAVQPFGTHYLNHNRYSRLDLALEWNDAVPVESSDRFAELYDKPQNEVDTIDLDFVNRVVNCIFRVINSTRTNSRGDPNSSVWHEGLPIFVTGGGSSCELYRKAITLAQNKLIEKSDLGRCFQFIELDQLVGNDLDFDIEVGARLTVAIGLTEDSENIARVVPHRDIEPMIHPMRHHVDHSEIYGDG